MILQTGVVLLKTLFQKKEVDVFMTQQNNTGTSVKNVQQQKTPFYANHTAGVRA